MTASPKTPIAMLAASLLLALTAAPGFGAAQADKQNDQLVEAYNQSGFALFGQLAAKPGNLVISPYSIGTAMAMALEGARGKTQAEMARVLRQTLAGADMAAANQRLSATLTGKSAEQDATVAIANALHLTHGGANVADSYKQLLHEKFAAELFANSDLAAINKWVSEKTNGKIEKILSKLDPRSVCVILNAVYFKGTWVTAFDKSRTAPAAFHLSKSETVDVPMMHQSGKFRMQHGAGFDAIALPYQGGRLTMFILLPEELADRGQAAIKLEENTVASTVAQLRNAQPKDVKLSMPKFKMAFGADLIPSFTQLGMRLAFDADGADFSGITGSAQDSGRLHISQIQHRAVIDVGEAGTEAAAATAVEAAARSMVVGHTPEFKIDRPFLYLIADETSGAILFMGRMTDPRPHG